MNSQYSNTYTRSHASNRVPLSLRLISMLATTIAALLAVTVVAVVTLFMLGYRPYVVMSSSMEPALPTGALCIIDTNTSFDDVNVGEVVGFRTESGDTVTHRVTEITDGGFITKGDANDALDGLCATRQNYVGHVRWTLPGVGRVLLGAKTPAGIGAVAIIMVLMLVANSLIERSINLYRREQNLPVSARSQSAVSFTPRSAS